jgi:hypothetical protein
MHERTEDDRPTRAEDTPEPMGGGAVGGPADPFGVEVERDAPPAEDVPATPQGDPPGDVDRADIPADGPSPAGEGTPGDVGGAGGGSTEDPGRQGSTIPGEGRIGTDPEGHAPRD